MSPLLDSLKPCALVAALALLVGNGCGGKAGEDNEAPSQDPGTSASAGLEPDRFGPGGTSTSSDETPATESEAATESETAPPPEALPDEELPLRARYVHARGSADDFLGRYCGACHGKSVPTSPCGLRFDGTDDLVALGLLFPLSYETSPIIRVMLGGSMPPPEVQPRPSAAELEQLRTFIDNPEFWSTLPPDGHSSAAAGIDAANNACDAAAEPAR